MNELREFGTFRLDTGKKILWHGDEPIDLPLRTIELLCVLTESGELVTKEEILNRVWQDSFVEESNLTSHIYRLRKMFAKYGESEDLIKTVPKRGYRFMGEVLHLSNTPEVVIARQTVTQTLIEEIDEPPIKALPPKLPVNRYWIPVIAVFVLMTTAFGYYFYSRQTSKIEGIKTIAVGKFSSLLDNEEEKVLALGIKEKLLLDLGNVKDLSVQNDNFDETEFDKIQNADAVLLGTVQKSDGQIRVNLRLLQTADKRQIWAASFNELPAGIFKLQDEISRKITDSLSVNLTKIDNERIYQRPTENKDAYEQYLQGRYFFNQRGIDYSGSLKKAKPFFERAIQLDPNFAEAYIGLADVINLLADEKNKFNPKYDEEYQQARQLINKALQINPNLAEAHAANGWIQLRYEWNPVEAEKSLLKAIELNPSLTNAYIWISQTYQQQEKTGIAVKNAEKAVKLEPASSRALGNLSSNYIYNGQCEKAIEGFPRLAQYFTNPADKNDQEGRLLSACGKCNEAIPILEETKKQQPKSSVTAYSLGYCYAATNQADKAREELKILEEKSNSGQSIFGRILVHAALGEKEKAMDVLQEFSKSKDPRILRILFDQRFGEFKNEPKFREMVRKVMSEK
jgi:DNA-binding winged helix-turn-helix (wHTH) protein/TolB-like protein/Tfp pilus assembly protein PilF